MVNAFVIISATFSFVGTYSIFNSNTKTILDKINSCIDNIITYLQGMGNNNNQFEVNVINVFNILYLYNKINTDKESLEIIETEFDIDDDICLLPLVVGLPDYVTMTLNNAIHLLPCCCSVSFCCCISIVLHEYS